MSFWAIAIAGYLYAVGSAADKEEEVVAEQAEKVKHEEKQKTTVDDGQGEEMEGQEEDEENVVIPEVAPEDAWFIPFGWARQCPPTFYKGSDPEWQSFVEFSKDRKRNLLLRSNYLYLMLCSKDTNT